MKLLLDMNLPPKLADILTSRGIESVHWYTIGVPNAADEVIMSFAKNNDYVVVTHDLDFSTILSVTHGQKPSIIQIRVQDLNAEEITELIEIAIVQNADEIKRGAILSLDANKARLRILPL